MRFTGDFRLAKCILKVSNYLKLIKNKNRYLFIAAMRYGLVLLCFGWDWYDFASFGVCPLSTYVTMQNLELVSSKMAE